MYVTEMPKIGERVRFAISYRGDWRVLFWMRVSDGGDIYCGALDGKPGTARSLSRAISGPENRIEYADTIKLTGSDVPKSPRVSFHPDGRINIGNDILYGRALSTLSKPRQLCLIQFAHPRAYLPPKRKSDNDYDVGLYDYPVDDERPMYGALFVEPWPQGGKAGIRKLASMTKAVNYAVGFRGLTRTPDLAVQLVVGHGPRGQWPELPAVLVTGSRERLKER
jgi:hypothetical protein